MSSAQIALAAEVERLRAELAKADGQINRCVDQNKYLESTISRLREYAEHTTGCDSWAWPGGMKKPHAKCDCGYDELIRSLEEKP